MRIVLLGSPGSGKGTHSVFLENHFHIPHISTGDIFRGAISSKTPLGVLAASYIDKGNLVPDEVTINLVKERISQNDCKNGFILDGFPRTVEQAKALDTITGLDLIIYFDIDLDFALTRLLDRRVCKKCGAIYNLMYYKQLNCEKCGGELIVRDDDNPQVIKKRFDVYKAQTYPVVEFYKNRLEFKKLNANLDFEDVRKQLKGLVSEYEV